MKTTKSKLAQPGALLQSSDHESVDIDEISKYLKKVSYWIGQIVFEFNELEHTITNVIGERINTADVRGYEYVFLTGLAYSQKIELLKRLYKYEINFVNPPERQKQLSKKTNEIIEEMKALGNIRNTIIHANYYSLDKNGFIRKEIKFSESDAEEQWVIITRDFLVENLNRIMEVSKRLEEFDEEIYI